MLDYIRIGCAVPEVKVADVRCNTAGILEDMHRAWQQGVDLLVFPELCITGYTCADLFFQSSLLDAAREALTEIAGASGDMPGLQVVVGLPVRLAGSVYNCAALVSGGMIHGYVPKSYLSRDEGRWFAPGLGVTEEEYMGAPFGTDLLFEMDGVKVGIEICEDLFAPVAPSARLAMSGAEVIVNPAASFETAGKREKRRALVANQSSAGQCIYAFVSAGCTESTTDMVYSGHSVICENGKVLAENEKRIDSGYLLVQDADVGVIRMQRYKSETFRTCADLWAEQLFTVTVCEEPLKADGSLYPVRKLAFIPETKQDRLLRCNEIFQMQVTGLKQRLSAIGGANAVIGISGGLDSTLALLVAVEAMHQLGRPATDVYGVTMPCFGTSDRTYNNSWQLMQKLGVTAKEINIRSAVNQHFGDIGHDPQVHNATYENSQARERTQILMDYASVVGGIVVGTGDLSELALGWCTYNGDHMSMYGVNADVPKTLIRWIIDAVSEREAFAPAREVLQDVLDTPISPELLPPDAEGKISQQTEDLVGPYALHDFYLYYVLKYGFRPEKIYKLACRAFREDFDAAVIKKWLVNFYRRFFTQQFKRSCMADGVKVGSIGLGPRGDWAMPSDAASRLWLEEAQNL